MTYGRSERCQGWGREFESLRPLQIDHILLPHIAGGVSANTCLRERLEQALAKIGAEVFYARHEFCTDNGAMIAYAGTQRLVAGASADLSLTVQPRWPLDSLPALDDQSASLAE